MRKSEKRIEADFYKLVSASPLAEMVSGAVYRGATRPDDSTKEDIIIKFLTGTEMQIQSGIIVMNIYIPDITLKGTTQVVEDTSRVEVLEDAVLEFLRNCTSSEYLYTLDGTPRSLAVEGINQHIIYTRIHFQRFTEE